MSRLRLLETLVTLLLVFGAAGCVHKKFGKSSDKQAEKSPPASEINQMMSALCDEGTARGSPGAFCDRCPSDTTFAGESSPFTWRGVVRGSFLGKGSEGALIHLEGCEPHALNFGGSVLLQRKGGRWRKVAYQAGLLPTECLKLRGPEGREELVCETEWTGQGQRVHALVALTYVEGGLRTQDLLTYGDNLGTLENGLKKRKLYRITREEWTAGVDDRGKNELTLKLLVRSSRRAVKNGNPGKLLSSGETVDLHWSRGGQGLELERKDQAALARLKRITAGGD